MIDELFIELDSKILSLLRNCKTTCYERSRPLKNLQQGSRQYAECVTQSSKRIHELERTARLKLTYLNMRADRVRTPDEVSRVNLEAEVVREVDIRQMLEEFKV